MSVITIRETQKTETGFAARLIFNRGDDGEYSINITDPFTAEEEQRLEWYFEEWLTYPMLNGRKAEAAKNSVTGYGESLFEQVFKTDLDAYSCYRQLRSNLKEVRIEIVGDSPEFHALHWEAMRDKDLPRPLAVDWVMVRKRITKAASVPANIAESPVINLLVVTSRPNEENDVGYRTISRPLIEVIQNSELPVKVDLLRPGTYESLERHLEEKGAGYYHFIHFDCHGGLMGYQDIQEGMRRNRYTYQTRWGREDIEEYDGVKAFLFLDGESKGKADPVEAEELASLLTGKRIPVCILNACQSGKQVKSDGETEENSRETSLGSRLMTAGMQMVVAMGYSVTVSAAKLMMKQVYKKLFEGKKITEAIRLGRRELFNNTTRKAYFNTDIDLEDWLLPVVYSNQGVNLNLREFTPEEEEKYFENLASSYQNQYTPPEYGFIGRDLEILKIEKALFRHNILLLQGMGGTGKTTLLNYLRSWWETTNFAPDIFYFGYDKKAWTLTQIIFEIGKRLYGKFEFGNFQAMNLTAQVQKLLKKLKSQPYVLILDNLESVTGQALAIQNTLPSDEQKQLQDFLTRLVNGKTRVILGSRSDESWLKGAFKQNIYKLQGLDPQARTELSNKILERNVGNERKIAKIREDGDFQKLMELLAGYPLAMEVVLANLKNLSPQEILAKLQAADINLDTGSEDKTQSILKCVEYSHSNLSPDAQKLLLCLAPFSGFIRRDKISDYAEELQKLEQFQDYDFDKFDDAIQEAINWGLLSDLSPNPSPGKRGEEELLQIQPVFPFFLKATLAELDGATREALQEGFKNHYRSLARSYQELMGSKEAQERKSGIYFCQLEYENLYNALQICLEKQEDFDISFCLDNYFISINDPNNRAKFTEQLCQKISNFPPEFLESKIGYQIGLALHRNGMSCQDIKQYDLAEKNYKKALEAYEKLREVEERDKQLWIAGTYHQLGRLAEDLREYQQAQDYYRKALEIYIEYGDRYESASTYHQLGRLAEELREYHQARDYYQNALEICIEYDDRYDSARVYHQLGMVAQNLREYHQARDYYQNALDILIEYGDRYGSAKIYNGLGVVAQDLREYEQARDFYQNALDILIEYGDRYGSAKIYNGLGIVAQDLGEYEQARDYYQNALEISIEYGDRYGSAVIYHQLGTVAQDLGEYEQARDYYQNALEIKIEYGNKYSQALTLHCLGTLAKAEENYPEARNYLQQALEIYVEYKEEYWAGVARKILEDLPE